MTVRTPRFNAYIGGLPVLSAVLQRCNRILRNLGYLRLCLKSHGLRILTTAALDSSHQLLFCDAPLRTDRCAVGPDRGFVSQTNYGTTSSQRPPGAWWHPVDSLFRRGVARPASDRSRSSLRQLADRLLALSPLARERPVRSHPRKAADRTRRAGSHRLCDAEISAYDDRLGQRPRQPRCCRSSERWHVYEKGGSC